jgi:hypothetical protein
VTVPLIAMATRELSRAHTCDDEECAEPPTHAVAAQARAGQPHVAVVFVCPRHLAEFENGSETVQLKDLRWAV